MDFIQDFGESEPRPAKVARRQLPAAATFGPNQSPMDLTPRADDPGRSVTGQLLGGVAQPGAGRPRGKKNLISQKLLNEKLLAAAEAGKDPISLLLSIIDYPRTIPPTLLSGSREEALFWIEQHRNDRRLAVLAASILMRYWTPSLSRIEVEVDRTISEEDLEVRAAAQQELKQRLLQHIARQGGVSGDGSVS